MVFLKDPNDLPKVAAVRKEFFKTQPTSTTVQISRLVRDADVEIDAIAVL